MTDAQKTAQRIVDLLLKMHRETPNVRTESTLTSFRQNAIAEGVFQSVKCIREAFNLPPSPE